jgi:plasmid maintenance system antidote protein VapI
MSRPTPALTLGDQLALYARRHGLRTREMAAQMGVSRDVMRRLIRDEQRRLDATVAAQLGMMLGMPIEDVIGLHGQSVKVVNRGDY